MKTRPNWLINPLIGRRVLGKGKIWVGGDNNIEQPVDCPDIESVTEVVETNNERKTFTTEIKEIIQRISNYYNEAHTSIEEVTDIIQQYFNNIDEHREEITHLFDRIQNIIRNISEVINNMSGDEYHYYRDDYNDLRLELQAQLDFIMNAIALLNAIVGGGGGGGGIAGVINNINVHIEEIEERITDGCIAWDLCNDQIEIEWVRRNV